MERTFDNYISSKETTIVAHDELLPLSLSEITLSVGDSHAAGYYLTFACQNVGYDISLAVTCVIAPRYLISDTLSSPRNHMKRDHLKWGPKFPHYLNTLDERLEDAFHGYVNLKENTSAIHDGLPPLSLLETALSVGENLHRVDYQHGEKSLPVLMSMIRSYVELTETGIFRYYYGYLCIRHLIRAISIGTLIENELLDDFLDNLDPELEITEVGDMLITETLQQMTTTLFKDNLSSIMKCLGYDSFSGRALLNVGGLSYEDAEFLAMMLWKDRRSLISLVQRRILLGLPALLFVLYGMMAIKDIPAVDKKWTQMQDITVRAYVTSINEEHDIMRMLVTHNQREMITNGLMGDSTTDHEDARNVIRAYNGMIERLSTQGPSPIVTLDSSNITFQYISSLLYEELSDCIPGVLKSGLERLWLEVDQEKEGYMENKRLYYIWCYSGDIFRNITQIWSYMNSEDKRVFLAMLRETDIISLLGRIVMMVFRGVDYRSEWDYLRGGLLAIREGLATIFAPTKASSHINYDVWLRVFNQFLLRADRMIPNDACGNYALEAMNVWCMFGPTSKTKLPSKECFNPRCPAVPMVSKECDTTVVCGRCLRAFYCSQRCQQSHWYLETLDTHKSVCNAGALRNPSELVIRGIAYEDTER